MDGSPAAPPPGHAEAGAPITGPVMAGPATNRTLTYAAWHAPFPVEYDYAAYLAHPRNADLVAFSAEQAAHHYKTYGRNAGRPCCYVEDRARFLSLVPPTVKLLEIGPFCIPSFRRDTHDVRYIDVRSTEELREWARTLSWADPDKVPDIDYVWQGEPYRTLTSEWFDAIFSSHNIEHQPCLVNHLRDAATLLLANGVYMMNIPDKRYCFDHYRPETTIADVLSAAMQRPTRHSARTLLGSSLLVTHNDAEAHWRGEHGPDPLRRPVTAAFGGMIRSQIEAVEKADGYVDAHAWQFTPDSFRHIIDALYVARLIPFKVERVYSTVRPRNEFHAILRLAPHPG